MVFVGVCWCLLVLSGVTLLICCFVACFVRLECLGGVFGVGLLVLVYCGATFERV